MLGLPIRMRRVQGLLVAAVATLSLLCASGTVRAQSASDVITLRCSNDVSSEHPQNAAWRAWAAQIAKDTDNHIQIKIYANSELYNGFNAAQAVALGNLEMAALSTPTMTGIIPSFDVLSLPFLAPTNVQAIGLTDPKMPLFQALAKAALAKNMFMIPSRMWESGTFPIIVHAKGETNLKGLQGKRVRTLGGSTLSDAMKALGADPVQMAASDVPTALQTGAIDAALGSFQWFDSTLSDVAGGAIDTGAMVTLGYFIVANKATWDKIPAKYQQVIIRDTQAANAKWTDSLAAADAKVKAHLKSSGHWIYELTPADRTAVNASIQPIWNGFKARDPVAFDAFMASRKQLAVQ